MKLVVDTSVWVSFLRRGAAGPAAGLRSHLEAENVLCCGPVVAEVLHGAAEPDRAALRRIFTTYRGRI